MGLDDIDDDAPPLPQRKAVAGKHVPRNDLNDIFGDLGKPQAPIGGTPLGAVAAQRPVVEPQCVLESFFGESAKIPSASGPVTPPPPVTGIDSLFDFSAHGEKKQHVDSRDDGARFLENFAMSAKGIPRRSDAPTLGQMKAPSTVAVTAQLLTIMNYYDVLGVDSKASVEEIHRQYKKKALELHPDKVGRNQTNEEAQLFKTITKAHEALTNAQQRAEYDASLVAPPQADWFSHLGSVS